MLFGLKADLQLSIFTHVAGDVNHCAYIECKKVLYSHLIYHNSLITLLQRIYNMLICFQYRHNIYLIYSKPFLTAVQVYLEESFIIFRIKLFKCTHYFGDCNTAHLF